LIFFIVVTALSSPFFSRPSCSLCSLSLFLFLSLIQVSSRSILSPLAKTVSVSVQPAVINGFVSVPPLEVAVQVQLASPDPAAVDNNAADAVAAVLERMLGGKQGPVASLY
jgi:hypothetical protein